MAIVVPEPIELTQEEFTRLVEERVRKRLGLSVEEFIRALRDGKLDPEAPEVADLALLVGVP